MKNEFNEVFKFNKVPFFLWVAATFFIMGFDFLLMDFINYTSPFLPSTERMHKISKEIDEHFFFLYYNVI